MIRFANIFILLVMCSFTLQAQPDEDLPGPGPGKGPGRQRILEKMEAMRVAFLTNRLDLTTDESIKFWPVYNEYSNKRKDLRMDQFDQRQELKEDKKMSEEDSKKALENQLRIQEQELTLKKNYYEKFKAILPAQKLAKLEPAEMEFNREVIKKLQERRERRMGGGFRGRR